ncbi:MAG: hypothetical protein JXA92_12615 [candidate division Zixibacteria bacterium]|nr:hypothetical protein [candidate division Zixibacteria bacterium]
MRIIKFTILIGLLAAPLISAFSDNRTDDQKSKSFILKKVVTGSSENFILKKAAISSNAVKGESATFKHKATAGQPLTDAGHSESFNLSQGFWEVFDNAGCCVDYTGNTNCSEFETPDISDITRLIDYLYLSHVPLCCPGEADVNASGDPEPDISDITRLIDFLYLSHEPLPDCP